MVIFGKVQIKLFVSLDECTILREKYVFALKILCKGDPCGIKLHRVKLAVEIKDFVPVNASIYFNINDLVMIEHIPRH
jgi:hypothetical protein